MKYIVTVNGKDYEVEVEKGQATVLGVTQSAPVTHPALAQVHKSAQVQAVQPSEPAKSGGEVIKAPMPGTILGIKVAPGAAVKRGETLLILEAMKMENEISAPRDGVVGEIAVAKGANVSTGAALLSLV